MVRNLLDAILKRDKHKSPSLTESSLAVYGFLTTQTARFDWLKASSNDIHHLLIENSHLEMCSITCSVNA